jgi:hypothetical protein
MRSFIFKVAGSGLVCGTTAERYKWHDSGVIEFWNWNEKTMEREVILTLNGSYIEYVKEEDTKVVEIELP